MVQPEHLGRVASAFRAACVSCGFCPGRRACPPGARAAPSERAQSSVLAAARLARSPPSARLAEATWAGSAGNFVKLSRSQTCRKFEGKPRPRAIPSQIPLRGASEGSQLPFQTTPGQRRGGSRGRGWRAPEGSAQASGKACRDAEGSASLPPPRSGGIAPVGGLRVALWVARLGLKRTSPLSRATELDFSWGGEGVVETDAIFHLELGLAISSNTPGHNQGQREPTGWLKPLTAPLQLCLKGTL